MPIIGFPRGAGVQARSTSAETGVDGVELRYGDAAGVHGARAVRAQAVVQGNLDPLLLVAGGQAMEQRVGEILAALAGISRSSSTWATASCRETPPENVARLVELVRTVRETIQRVIPAPCATGSSDRTSARARRCAGSPGTSAGMTSAMLLWLKALHVIAVIAWMAGLLYLPRLFVYHCEAEKGSKQSETFKVMEQRLLRLIMNPAMIVVWVTGPLLAWAQGMIDDRWLWAKFALVVLLTGYHHALGLGARTSPRTATRATSASIASPTRCRRC